MERVPNTQPHLSVEALQHGRRRLRGHRRADDVHIYPGGRRRRLGDSRACNGDQHTWLSFGAIVVANAVRHAHPRAASQPLVAARWCDRAGRLTTRPRAHFDSCCLSSKDGFCGRWREVHGRLMLAGAPASHLRVRDDPLTAAPVEIVGRQLRTQRITEAVTRHLAPFSTIGVSEVSRCSFLAARAACRPDQRVAARLLPGTARTAAQPWERRGDDPVSCRAELGGLSTVGSFAGRR
jgi:hypothetical protein